MRHSKGARHHEAQVSATPRAGWIVGGRAGGRGRGRAGGGATRVYRQSTHLAPITGCLGRGDPGEVYPLHVMVLLPPHISRGGQCCPRRPGEGV